MASTWSSGPSRSSSPGSRKVIRQAEQGRQALPGRDPGACPGEVRQAQADGEGPGVEGAEILEAGERLDRRAGRPGRRPGGRGAQDGLVHVPAREGLPRRPAGPRGRQGDGLRAVGPPRLRPVRAGQVLRAAGPARQGKRGPGCCSARSPAASTARRRPWRGPPEPRRRRRSSNRESSRRRPSRPLEPSRPSPRRHAGFFTTETQRSQGRIRIFSSVSSVSLW